MSDAAQFRSFLLRAPKPASLKAYVKDEVHEFAVDDGFNFARMAETLDALGCDRVECYDAEGMLTRAEKPRRRPANMSAGMKDLLSGDPEAARIAHFADLLHRAYEQSTQLAFEKLVEMFQLQSTQMQQMTQRIERAERAYVAKLAENAKLRFGGSGAADEDDDEEFGSELFQQFMAGFGRGRGRPRKQPVEDEPAETSEEESTVE